MCAFRGRGRRNTATDLPSLNTLREEADERYPFHRNGNRDLMSEKATTRCVGHPEGVDVT